MGNFRDKLKQAGFAGQKMSPGDIFTVKDSAVVFPEVALGESRTEHEFRTVLILSRQKTCDNPFRMVVLIAPMSSKVETKTDLELLVEPDRYNNLRTKSRLLLGHVQPILKRDLETKIGKLGPRDLDNATTRILMNLGIVEG